MSENTVVLKEPALKDGYSVLNLNAEQLYTFTQGIPGFEKIKQYCLLLKEDEVPFLRLSAVGGFNLEFVVVNPWAVCQDYRPEIADEDLKSIGAPNANEMLVVTITVVAQPLSESTVNLAAPLIINIKNGQGKQVIIRNIKDYSSQHHIFKT